MNRFAKFIFLNKLKNNYEQTKICIYQDKLKAYVNVSGAYRKNLSHVKNRTGFPFSTLILIDST